MYKISAFSDEIADDLETQIETLNRHNIEYIDLRSVDGKNVLDFTDEDISEIKSTLDEQDISVAGIGSPIGKVPVENEFDSHKDDCRRIFEIAEAFDVDYVRVFSYWIPEDDDPDQYREEVISRMQWKADVADETGVSIYHENEKDIYGDTPERCRDLATSVESSAFGLIFDPANFLEVGVQSYPDALVHLVEHISGVHIKDAKFDVRGEIRPAGEGDGHIAEILSALDARDFSGYASLEPHLTEAGKMGGYSGPEGFGKAADALFKILTEENLEYK